LVFSLVSSGCATTDRGDDFVSHSECSLTLRTSGAVEGGVNQVEGCTHSRTSFAGENGLEDIQITMGVLPRDSRPYFHVELAFYELLGEAGEGTPVEVLLRVDEDRLWQTPQGACVADYESEACDSEEVDDGVRYLVSAVDCVDPAERESEEPIAIDQLSLRSSCQRRAGE
jgi:hypothetical protein